MVVTAPEQAFEPDPISGRYQLGANLYWAGGTDLSTPEEALVDQLEPSEALAACLCCARMTIVERNHPLVAAKDRSNHETDDPFGAWFRL